MAQSSVSSPIDTSGPATKCGLLRALLRPALAVLVFASVYAATIFAMKQFAVIADSDSLFGLEIRISSDPGLSAAADSFVGVRKLADRLIADPALIEDSALGPLPKMDARGRTPMTAYALSFDTAAKRPRIAIVIGGLDVSAANSKRALMDLPPQVTLAFAPFAPDAQNYVDRAREAGHEILVEVPMEPFDFPESDPGHHALLVAASAEENLKRLDWAMSRFTGYVGITNRLGGRFLSEENAIMPVLGETARRGLLFFDNGVNSSSLALTGARHVNAPIATGSLTIDAIQTKDAIDEKLAELEADARRNGAAVGVGSVYPITIARVAAWAETLQARGFDLAPISALAARPEQKEATASAPER